MSNTKHLPWTTVITAFLVSCGLPIFSPNQKTEPSKNNISVEPESEECDLEIPEKAAENSIQCLDVETVELLLKTLDDPKITSSDLEADTGSDCPEGFIKIKTVQSPTSGSNNGWDEL